MITEKQHSDALQIISNYMDENNILKNVYYNHGLIIWRESEYRTLKETVDELAKYEKMCIELEEFARTHKINWK